MEPLLERLSERLSAKITRRGFFRLTGKVTAAVAAAGAGFTRFYNEAAAGIPYKCCSLAFSTWCPCDPLVCGCPSGSHHYWSWNCCWNGCFQSCQECYYNAAETAGCSYSAPTGEGCGGGGGCLSAPPA